MIKKHLTVAVLLACAGCTGFEYVTTNYGGISAEQFQFGGSTYRVFDKPSESRLMITPSLGAAAGAGLTFGAGVTPQAQLARASSAYLKSSGRACQVTEFYAIIETQYEAFYEC